MIINTDYVAWMDYNKNREVLYVMMNNTCYNIEWNEDIAKVILTGSKAELYIEYIEETTTN